MSESPERELERILEAFTDSILDASDEEILEDVRASGEDPAEVAARVKRVLSDALQAHRRQRLNQARTEYEQSAKEIAESEVAELPSEPQDRRLLLDNILAARPDLQSVFTAQFRDYESASDHDIKSYLQQLAKLGVLDELEEED